MKHIDNMGERVERKEESTERVALKTTNYFFVVVVVVQMASTTIRKKNKNKKKTKNKVGKILQRRRKHVKIQYAIMQDDI